jgi:hypothetical protein
MLQNEDPEPLDIITSKPYLTIIEKMTEQVRCVKIQTKPEAENIETLENKK